MEILTNVLRSKDYNIFKSLEGNREVNKVHVDRLKKSFEGGYLLNPILVNSKMQIIDGQHRFNAAKSLGLHINYIICPDYGLKEIQVLNSNMKNWNKNDYLEGFCDLGNEEYIKFRDFKNEFTQFNFSCIEQLIVNNTHANRGSYFKDGDLKVFDINQSRKFANDILKIKSFYDGFGRRSFVAAMITILKIEEFEIERFIRKLEVCPNKLHHCANVTQYRALIENIYNWKATKKINLRF